MMAEVLVAHVFESAVGSAAQPGQEAAEHRVVHGYAPENQVVPALVDHISRDRHRMREENKVAADILTGAAGMNTDRRNPRHIAARAYRLARPP